MLNGLFPRTVLIIIKGFHAHYALILFNHTILIDFLGDYNQRGVP